MSGVSQQIMLGEGAVALSAESSQFLSRSSGLDSTHQAAYIALIDGLVADGVWSSLDALYILATQDTTNALLNLVSSSSYGLTAHGSPSFSADNGYTGTAGSTTKYLDTGFNPSTAGGNFGQNSAHLSAWNLSNLSGSANRPIGGGNSAGSLLSIINPKNASGLYSTTLNNASGPAPSISDGRGFLLINRSGANAQQQYQNGSSTASDATSAAGLTAFSIFILAHNLGGSASLGYGGQLAAASIGGSMTSTQVTAFYSRLRSYMTAVGQP